MIPALFRGSLWLAALAAGAAALAPEGPSSAWLAAAAGAAGLSAWWLWRSAQAHRASWPLTDAASLPPAAPQIDSATVQDVVARIRQLASGASSLDAALHEAATILKSELGALDARVYRVKPARLEAHATPRITELIATRSGFRPAGELPANDGSSLVIAIRRQIAVLALPEAVALPIVCGSEVVAALLLGDIAITVDDDALHQLLTVAASTLAEIATRDAPTTSRIGEAQSRSANESQFHGSGFDGLLTPHPLRQGPSPTMLTRRSPLHAPAAGPDGAATGSHGNCNGPTTTPTVLDAAALARLAELDPGGTSRLLPRVLTAYLTSVARLHPQFVAARPLGDFEAIRHVTHTLKSSSASIGAIKLAAICAEIDAMIRTADTAGLAPILDSMDAELERVLKAVKHLLGGHP